MEATVLAELVPQMQVTPLKDYFEERTGVTTITLTRLRSDVVRALIADWEMMRQTLLQIQAEVSDPLLPIRAQRQTIDTVLINLKLRP